MTTTTWIIIAVVVLAVILVAALLARKATHRKRAAEADRIREEVHVEGQRLEKREAIAAETEAKARAAAAEAEAKAAEAARLRDRASSHREVVDSARTDLDERREHADALDPRVKASDAADRDRIDQNDRIDDNGRVTVRDGVDANDPRVQDVQGRHADGRPGR